jgi:hypothetical protein
MRFVKRRDPASRPANKPEGIIIFQGAAARNWRERVRALKAAQDAEQLKDGAVAKQERS